MDRACCPGPTEPAPRGRRSAEASHDHPVAIAQVTEPGGRGGGAGVVGPARRGPLTPALPAPRAPTGAHADADADALRVLAEALVAMWQWTFLLDAVSSPASTPCSSAASCTGRARQAPHPGHRPGRCTADPRVGHRHHLRRLGPLHDLSRR